MEQFIDFKNVSLSFAEHQVIADLNLKIPKGQIISLFGPSGCGKSTIIKMILGIHKPQSGHIDLEGAPAEAYSRAIAYVPQDNDLLPWLNIRENIELWQKESKGEQIAVEEILELVELKDHEDKLPKALSGGMARRTALARALATGAELLCFDEAMVGIEKGLRKKILSGIRKHIISNQLTGIFISHDHQEAITLSDRIIVFSPPKTVVLKDIDLSALNETDRRDHDFTSSEGFKNIYTQMLGI